MRAAAEILTLAENAGVHLRVENGKIVAGPRAAVQPSLVELIRSHKDALIQVLTGPVTAVTLVTRSQEEREDYTAADLAEIDKLLRELASLEAWTDVELAEKLSQRKRMAPVNVIPVLREIREIHKAALAVWPNQPAKRADIRLCKLDHVELAVIDGSKGESNRVQSSKTPAQESEAA